MSETTIAGAMKWVHANCSDEAVQRLRSRIVAKTLADEIERLRAALADTLDFVERHSNRWDGINGKHPNDVATVARELLLHSAAPQPPAVSAEPAGKVFVVDGKMEGSSIEKPLATGTYLLYRDGSPSADVKDAALKLAKETLENLVGVDATERLMTKEAVAAIDAAMRKGGEK